jgi:predicted nucleic acid-binding protein
MRRAVIVDTGPLVALLNRRERHHQWCREQFKLLRPPLLTSEAVISEGCFLLQDIAGGTDALLELLSRGVVTIPFTLMDELPAVARLVARYGSVPMSLADACLVRMSEQYADSRIFTLDRHFRIYRKSGRAPIPTLMPN